MASLDEPVLCRPDAFPSSQFDAFPPRDRARGSLDLVHFVFSKLTST
jgi:hypothetical protein